MRLGADRLLGGGRHAGDHGGCGPITTATYFAFRDDVLTRLIARQANMQFGYEDRIAELRAQIDRISSRQLLDQEQYEQKLEQMLRRQATLESRASAVGGLPDPTVTGSIKPGRKGERTRRARRTSPSPISDKGAFLLQSDQSTLLDQPLRLPARGRAAAIDAKLARLQASLDRVEQRKASSLSSIEESYEDKARRIRGVLADLGFEKAQGLQDARARGGDRRPVHPGQAGSRSGQLRPPALARQAGARARSTG